MKVFSEKWETRKKLRIEGHGEGSGRDELGQGWEAAEREKEGEREREKEEHGLRREWGRRQVAEGGVTATEDTTWM